MNQTDETQFQQQIPPSPKRVAARALCLIAVAYRGSIEDDPDLKNAAIFHQNLLVWVRDCDLIAELDATELALLESPIGNLTSRQKTNAWWRCEGMAVFAWALNVAPLPPYDEAVDPQIAAYALGLWKPRDETVSRAPQLRPLVELQQLSDTMLALHWRLREFSLRPQAINWIEQNRTAWFGPLDVSQLRFNKNDLEIGNKTIVQANPEEIQNILSITAERHTAALWLIGDNPIYSEISTDT